jgi:hypothetical protein
MSAMTMRLLRVAREHATITGGTVDSMVSGWDEERQGRVVVLTMFWPGEIGYQLAAAVALPEETPQ